MEKILKNLFFILLFITIVIISTIICKVYLGTKQAVMTGNYNSFANKCFIIDTSQTDLSILGDSSKKYANLKIYFLADTTFYFNQSVPFIYDTVGRWLPTDKGFEGWNRVMFKKPSSNEYFHSVDFGQLDEDDNNAKFYFNSMFPRDSGLFIQEIYFRINKNENPH